VADISDAVCQMGCWRHFIVAAEMQVLRVISVGMEVYIFIIVLWKCLFADTMYFVVAMVWHS